MTTASLEQVRAFRAVAEAASFTRAARSLGLDKSKVSRDVRALEATLGATLLVRSTRAVRLSEEGQALLERVTPLLAGIEEALQAVPDRAAAPSGTVTLTTTPDIGRELLAPLLPAFRARYPAIRLRVVLADTLTDLLASGVDVALRVGRPAGQELVARKLGELCAGFFAAPSYLRRRGTPLQPRDLANHDGLWPSPPRGQRSFAPREAPPAPAIECADFALLAELARAGGGVALLPTFLAARDVAAGALVRVLPQLSLMNAPLFLVTRERELPARVTALRRFLLEARLLEARATASRTT